MSDFSDQGHPPGQAGSPATPSAGAVLRRAREAAGVHIAALSVALKVPVKRLEALEADRHDLLPDAVFVRALASSVCRHLKIDPAQVLPLLPSSPVQPPSVEGRINEPFRPAPQAAGSWPQVSRPALIAAAVLAAAALAVYLVPELTQRSASAPAAPTSSAPSAPASDAAAPAQPVPAAPAPAGAPAQVIEAVPVAPASPPASLSAPAAPPAPPPAAPPAPVPPPTAPTPATR